MIRSFIVCAVITYVICTTEGKKHAKYFLNSFSAFVVVIVITIVVGLVVVLEHLCIRPAFLNFILYRDRCRSLRGS